MHTSKIAETQREWEDLACMDPLWAIVSHREKKFNRWKWDEFFDLGQVEIDLVMRSCGQVTGDNGRVLDFGCGVGRLSRALFSYFGEVYGVDISEEMIGLAKKHTPSCTFLLNRSSNLNLFQNDFFDFVYSSIVLQHQASMDVVKAYIREFVRVVKPNGTIVFQMPYRLSFRCALAPRRRLYSLLRGLGISPGFLYNHLGLNPMRTIALSCEDVEAAISAAGGQLVRSYADSLNQYSMSYVVTKLASR